MKDIRLKKKDAVKSSVSLALHDFFVFQSVFVARIWPKEWVKHEEICFLGFEEISSHFSLVRSGSEVL